MTASDGTSYDVTLDQVTQNAAASPYETPQNAGDHFAAAQFTIKGDSGSTSDDANSDANAIGSDGTQYPFAAASPPCRISAPGCSTSAPARASRAGWRSSYRPA